MDWTTIIVTTIIQLSALAGIIAKLILVNRTNKKDSTILKDEVKGVSNLIVKLDISVRDLLLKTKIHNIVQNQANHYSLIFGITGNSFSKAVFQWGKLIEEFAVDYYYSDFRKNAKTEQIKLRKYVNEFMKRNEDSFSIYLQDLFDNPRYDKKKHPIYFHQLVEQSECFTLVNQKLILDLIKNGYESDSFQVDISNYLCNFYDQFVKDVQIFMELKESLNEDEI